MQKELIITIIIVIIIFIGDFASHNYIKKNAEETTSSLNELKEFVEQENDMAIEKSNEILERIKKIHKILAFYVEHNELEKVETYFTVCDSLIKSKQYDMAISELDKTIYVLDHITDRYSLSLENLF